MFFVVPYLLDVWTGWMHTTQVNTAFRRKEIGQMEFISWKMRATYQGVNKSHSKRF